MMGASIGRADFSYSRTSKIAYSVTELLGPFVAGFHNPEGDREAEALKCVGLACTRSVSHF